MAGFVSAQSTLVTTAILKRRLAAIRKIHLLLTGKKSAAVVRGFLFRRVRGQRIGGVALHSWSVNRILKDIAMRAGLPAGTVRGLSGHSMRVGAAQDMISSWFGKLPIMRDR